MFVKSIENIFCPKLLIEKLLEKDFFMKIDIFGIFGPKTEKMGRARKGLFLFCPFFLIESKSIENTKKLSPQMIKVCQKKFPPFKIKNGFLAIFVILEKSQKWPKIHFLF